MVQFPGDPSDDKKNRSRETGIVLTGTVSDDRHTSSHSGVNTLENQTGWSATTRRVSHDLPSVRTNPGSSVSGDGNEEDLQGQSGNDDRQAHNGEDETLGSHANGHTSQAHIPDTPNSVVTWSNLMKRGGGDEHTKLIKSKDKDKQKEIIRVLNQTIEDKNAKIKEMKEE